MAAVHARTPTLCAAVTVLWGIPYLLIAVALDRGWGPLSIAAGRILLGAVALGLLCGRRTWGVIRSAPVHLCVLAVVEVIVPFALITRSEETVSSSTAGVLIATEPTFVLVAARLLGARAQGRPATLVGVAIGFVGVLLVLGAPRSGTASVLVVAAAASYGLGASLVDGWFPDAPRLPLAAAMLTIAGLPMLLAAWLAEPVPPLTGSGTAVILTLGAACTAGGFATFFALISAAGAASAAVITYTAPLVALVLGVTALGEPLSWSIAGGTTLVLAGAWLTLRPGRLSTPAGRRRRA